MYKAVGYNSLGETILVNTLSSAYYAMTKKSLRENEQMKEGKECLVFIQNSGIHQIVNIFDLYLNADKMQNLFFYYVEMA